MRIQLASSAFVWLICCSVQAGIINVPDDQPTIQLAINAANPGDVVIVAEGEYFENINFFGKAITVRSTDPNDAGVVLKTIINGSSFGSVVFCTNGEGSDTVLSGFIITNGNSPFDGGGMLNSGSNPTVTNCSFIGNTASQIGGGMANFSSSPTVTNCSFIGNTSSEIGGGMFNFDSSPTVTNCSFIGNTATSVGGGGMFNTSTSHPIVTNTGFCNNTPSQTNDPIEGVGISMRFCVPPIPVSSSCPADIIADSRVNVTDLLALLAAWGACP